MSKRKKPERKGGVGTDMPLQRERLQAMPRISIRVGGSTVYEGNDLGELFSVLDTLIKPLHENGEIATCFADVWCVTKDEHRRIKGPLKPKKR